MKEVRQNTNKYIYRRTSSSRNCEYYWHNNYKYCFSIGLAQCLSVLVIVIMLWYKERPKNQKKKKEERKKWQKKYEKRKQVYCRAQQREKPTSPLPETETNFLTLDAKYRFPRDRNISILIHGLVNIIQGDPFFNIIHTFSKSMETEDHGKF